jgi:hypothetical protein
VGDERVGVLEERDRDDWRGVTRQRGQPRGRAQSKERGGD